MLCHGAPAGARTPDTRLKRAVLYLLSYWGLLCLRGQQQEKESWDGGTRTHYIGVKVRCVTITLHPNVSIKEAGTTGLFSLSRVGYGARTHDTRNHNPVLYQLS